MLSTTNWHTDLLNNLNNSYLNDIDKLNICKDIIQITMISMYLDKYNDICILG